MVRYRIARYVFKLVQWLLLARLQVTGRENILRRGPYLVTTNHMSAADTPILLISFPPLPWRFFAGEKWQAHPIFGPIMHYLGGIYIQRGEVDRRALREALAAIEEGAVFGLAPEGSRSKTAQLSRGKDGAAYLASRTNVPIVPVGIVDSDKLFANAKRLRPTNLQVRIGQPFTLPDLGHRVRSADLSAYTELIMVHIAALLPERYHGAYKDSLALKALLAGDDPWPLCVGSAQPPQHEENSS